MRRYDRGVRWEQERLDVHGTRWVSMYLPVWLYSYHQPGRNGGMLHYIAVNGRTGETMGSVPVQQWKLLLAALTVGTFLEAIALWILVSYVMSDDSGLWLLAAGPAGATGAVLGAVPVLPQHRQVACVRARNGHRGQAGDRRGRARSARSTGRRRRRIRGDNVQRLPRARAADRRRQFLICRGP